MGVMDESNKLGPRGGFSSPVMDVTPPIENIISWYRSDIGVTIDSGVSVWADQSGGGNDLTQASSSLQPSFLTNQLNGYPAVSFDGTDDFMKTALIPSLLQPCTVFIVFKLRTYIVGKTVFDSTHTFGSTLRTNVGSPTMGLYAGSYINNSNFVVNSFGLMTSIFDGASSLLQWNSTASTTGNCGVDTLEGLSLGARPDGFDNSQIDVVEVIILESAASVSEIAAVKAYVSSRYGI